MEGTSVKILHQCPYIGKFSLLRRSWEDMSIPMMIPMYRGHPMDPFMHRGGVPEYPHTLDSLRSTCACFNFSCGYSG